jgi:hypothetical protein
MTCKYDKLIHICVCIYFILSDFHSALYELVALQHTMLTIGLNESMHDYSVLGQKKIRTQHLRDRLQRGVQP